MMIFDRQKQRLLLEGKEYTPGDIHSLVAEGEGNHPSAIWDLYLFLNEWFNDDPVITVHTSGSTRSEERRVGKECRSRWSPYH